MSNWKTCQLGELITFQRGHDLPKTKMHGSKYPVVGSNGIIGYHDEYTTEAPSITIGRSGNVGKPFLYKGRSWSHNTSLYIREYKNVDPFFIYYFLQTLNLGNYAGGSAVPTLNRNHIHTLDVTVPDDIEEQRKIAAVLATFDEKIDNNIKINENLLQQARALFYQWVTGTSSTMFKLSDVADINPETYSPKDNWSFVNYLDTSSITAGIITEVQYILPSEEKLPSRARRILRKGDIVFSTVRPNQLHYGIIANPMPNMLGSTGFAVIRSKYAAIPNEIIYLALTEASFVEQMQQLAEQSVSTFPSIRPADLDACTLPEPKEKEGHFIEAIKAIFNAVATNNEENLRLSALRDTMLPRLMSGELDVSQLDL